MNERIDVMDEKLNGYCSESVAKGLERLTRCLSKFRDIEPDELTTYGLFLAAIMKINMNSEYLPDLGDDIEIIKPPPPPPEPTWEEQIEIWKADMDSYYKSSYWRSIRTKMFSYRQECFVCDSTEDLVIHHLNYDNIGNEDLGNLEVLCRSCHSYTHRKGNTS
jgi:hypothetical protein